MEYKNIQNGKNNDDFKRFILKAIIWTVLLTVSGIFLFPFLGWIIGKCFPVYVALYVCLGIGALLLVVWLAHVVLKLLKRRNPNLKFDLPIPKPSPKSLALSFSAIIVCGANILIDDHAKHVMGFAEGERWGKSIVTDYYDVFNMFGVEKIGSGRNEVIFRMYSSENEKTVLVLSMEEQKTDEWEGEKSFKMICKSVEYRTDGTPIRVFEEKTACYYYYDVDYCIDHDYDKGSGYYFGGKHVGGNLRKAIREWYFERIGLVCLSEYPTILKEFLSNEKETFSNVNNSQQESHYESIYDAPAPQTQSWGGNMMPVQDFGGGGIYGGIESSSQQHGYVTETYEDYCPVCYGTGKCQNCYGRGIYNDYTNTTRDCPSCINGNCSNCGGTGRVTKTRTVWK